MTVPRFISLPEDGVRDPLDTLTPTVRAWRHFIHNSYTAHVRAVLSYPFKAVGMGNLRYNTIGFDFNSGSCDVITNRFSMHLIFFNKSTPSVPV